jgi:hypothetical protein
MANRQGDRNTPAHQGDSADRGPNSTPERNPNQENEENVRGRGDDMSGPSDADDEFEDVEDLDEEEGEGEGSF